MKIAELYVIKAIFKYLSHLSYYYEVPFYLVEYFCEMTGKKKHTDYISNLRYDFGLNIKSVLPC